MTTTIAKGTMEPWPFRESAGIKRSLHKLVGAVRSTFKPHQKLIQVKARKLLGVAVSAPVMPEEIASQQQKQQNMAPIVSSLNVHRSSTHSAVSIVNLPDKSSPQSNSKRLILSNNKKNTRKTLSLSIGRSSPVTYLPLSTPKPIIYSKRNPLFPTHLATPLNPQYTTKP